MAITGVISRYNWLDWMKAIGMYLIILGHFFSVGHKYIYVFSVPLFFVLSGFLSKKEDSQKAFWSKMWNNLLFPMILIVLLSSIFEGLLGALGILYTFPTINGVAIKMLGIVIGSQKVLAGYWFIYTLVLLKCILQYTSGGKYSSYIHLLLFVILSIGAIMLENTYVKTEEGANSIINLSVAYPFFMFGNYLKSKKKFIADFKLPVKWNLVVLPCIVILVMVIGDINGFVWMYKGGYGLDYLMFIVGGIAGTILVYLISKCLDNYILSGVKDISNGSILILGFHYYLVKFIIIFTDKYSLQTCLYSLIILILFVPIIRLTKRYFPVLLGRRL